MIRPTSGYRGHGTAPLLELRQVQHAYRTGRQRSSRTTVLQGIHLRIDRGQVVGICGPSGGGKSTLARIAAGLERPLEGEVLAEGAPVWSLRAYPRLPRLGWAGALFQNPAATLDPGWRIDRILAEPFTARHRRAVPPEERARRTRSILSAAGLDGLPLRVRPRQLSGGQQQRIALARLLLAEPDLLVADEPTSALDVTNSAAVMHLLHDTARSGTGVLVVSHDLPMLEAVCDEIWLLAHGNLIAVT